LISHPWLLSIFYLGRLLQSLQAHNQKNRQKSVRLFSFSVTLYSSEIVLVSWGIGEEFGVDDDGAREPPRFEADGGDGLCASDSFNAWTSSSKNMFELFHSSCDFHSHVLSSSNSTSLLTVTLPLHGSYNL